tara:strand:+ start:54326 stop:55393 length:1068 start_codon:yes stop_codon:yes gene_type:complete
MTAALWSSPELVTKTVLTDESRQVTEGSIAVRGAQIVWRNSDGAVRLATPTGPNADTIRMALAHPECVDVRAVTLEVYEALVDGDLVGETSHLALHCKPARGEAAYIVSRDTLTAEALAGLSVGLIGDPRVPSVFRELLSSLPFLDLGATIGRPGAYSLESQVYLQGDGTPAFLSPLMPGENASVTSMRQRLDRLSKVSILMQLQGPEGTLFVRGQPDRLWLHSRLGSVANEEGMLRTPIAFAQTAAGDASVADGPRVPAVWVRRVATFARVTTGGSQMSIGAKIALTPLALAFDVALGYLGLVLGIWDDDDDDNQRSDKVRDNGNLNDGMSRARPRRSGEDEAQWRARENGQRR